MPRFWREEKWHEIEVQVKFQSEKAILVTDGVKDFWLPLSQVDGWDGQYGVTTNFFITEWIRKAKEKEGVDIDIEMTEMRDDLQ